MTRPVSTFEVRGRVILSMSTYSKPWLSVADQIAHLQARGMHIPNVDRATRYLTTAGYYHLSGYWYPMRSSGVVNGQRAVLDRFLPLESPEVV